MPKTTSKIVRSVMLAACVALLAFALAACGSSSKSDSGSGTTVPASASADITIKDLTFHADAVQTGSTVTVKNEDDVTHTVTSDDGKSFNVTVNAGSTATFKAPTTESQYKFHCNIHSSMHGTLNVQ
jgi:plastocyanin